MKRFCFAVLALVLGSVSRVFADPAMDAVQLSSPTSLDVSSATVVEEPFVWPVSKTIGTRKTVIVSKFGQRKVPAIPNIDTTIVVLPTSEMHKGVDFAVPPESNVKAARSGKVIFAGFSKEYASRADKKDQNHLVIVSHADRKSSRYVHMNRLMVRPGQLVKAGDVLGTSAASDEWTEPIVHFEIRDSNGQVLDPMTFLELTTQTGAR